MERIGYLRLWALATLTIALSATARSNAQIPEWGPEFMIGSNYGTAWISGTPVASNGSIFLIVWRTYAGNGILARRVSAAGAVLGTGNIVVSPEDGALANMAPVVASDGTDFLVVWARQSNRTMPDGTTAYISTVVAKRVSDSGVVLDATPRYVCDNAAYGHYGRDGTLAWAGTACAGSSQQPAIAYRAGSYFVVWQDVRDFVPYSGFNTSRSSLYGARVSRDGVVLEPSGVYLDSRIATSPLGDSWCDLTGPQIAAAADSWCVTFGLSGSIGHVIIHVDGAGNLAATPCPVLRQGNGWPVYGPLVSYTVPHTASNGTGYLLVFNERWGQEVFNHFMSWVALDSDGDPVAAGRWYGGELNPYSGGVKYYYDRASSTPLRVGDQYLLFYREQLVSWYDASRPTCRRVLVLPGGSPGPDATYYGFPGSRFPDNPPVVYPDVGYTCYPGPGSYSLGTALTGSPGAPMLLVQGLSGGVWGRLGVAPSPTDSTPPVCSADVSPRPNTDGWNSDDVTVTLSAVDEEGGSGVKEIVYSLNGGPEIAYSGPIVISAEGTTSVACFARDNAGNQSDLQRMEVQIDKTAPAITGSATPPPNANGWNNAGVTVNFDCSDGLSGIASCPASVTVSSEGGNQSVTGAATDKAGNTATATVSGINIDKTPPDIQVPDLPVLVTASRSTGATATFSTGATDGLSGVDSQSCEPASGSWFQLGRTTVVAQAADTAGNSRSSAFTVWVTYLWSGVLQPVNADGSSVFRQGRVVPVKFSLAGASAGIIDAAAHLSYVRIGDPDGIVNEADTPGQGDRGNQFRYDPETGQYVFNLSTAAMMPGRYRLIIELHDEVTRSVEVTLR